MLRTAKKHIEGIKKMKKTKYPEIKPQFRKDKKGNITEVYLPYNVYESIFQEIDELKAKAKEVLKKKK